MLLLHLRSSLQTPGIQNDTLLVMREHVACGEALQEAVVIAAISFADLAVHLQMTPLHLTHRSWHQGMCCLTTSSNRLQHASFAHSYAAELLGKK